MQPNKYFKDILETIEEIKYGMGIRGYQGINVNLFIMVKFKLIPYLLMIPTDLFMNKNIFGICFKIPYQ